MTTRDASGGNPSFSAAKKNPTQSGGILHLIKILIQYLTNKLWSYKIAYEYAGSGIAVANKFTQNRIDEFGSGRCVRGRESITEITACEIEHERVIFLLRYGKSTIYIVHLCFDGINRVIILNEKLAKLEGRRVRPARACRNADRRTAIS